MTPLLVASNLTVVVVTMLVVLGVTFLANRNHSKKSAKIRCPDCGERNPVNIHFCKNPECRTRLRQE